MYLFPLNRTKIVTIAVGHGFSWFGYVTVFFTLLGMAAYGFGLGIGLSGLAQVADPWPAAYIAGIAWISPAPLW